MSLIQLKDIYLQYNPPDGIFAVNGVTFEIKQGEIFSLLGPNGAGKTTLLSILSCLMSPTKGDATVNGYSVTKQAEQVKKCIGIVPQSIALYPNISAYENLMFWGRMCDLKGNELKKRAHELLEFANLTDRANDRVETYSGGMRRRLNVAVGLIHSPKVVYMDEPTVGIDPQSRRMILDNIKELNRQGLTVLYTTHYMEEAEELSHRVGIIDHGKLLALDTVENLINMVNNVDTIELILVENDARLEALCSSIEQMNLVEQVSIDTQKGHLFIQARNAKALLPQVISYISQASLNLSGINIQEPSLEKVFLQLTGRALRD